MMSPDYLQVGDTIADSPVGPGVITGVTEAGYPQVNHVAVGRLKRTDGVVLDPRGTYAKLEEVKVEPEGPPAPVAPPAAIMTTPQDAMIGGAGMYQATPEGLNHIPAEFGIERTVTLTRTLESTGFCLGTITASVTNQEYRDIFKIAMYSPAPVAPVDERDKLMGFPRRDLTDVAEAFDSEEQTVIVGNVTGNGDYHLESGYALAARFIRAALALEHAPCKGMSCGKTRTDQHHSIECHAEHAAAIAGGVFLKGEPAPIDMILHCPKCGVQHIDAPEPHDPFPAFGPGMDREKWTNPPHRSHLCHACGFIWRPADVATNGVAKIKTVGKADSAAPVAPVDERAAFEAAVKERFQPCAQTFNKDFCIGYYNSVPSKTYQGRKPPSYADMQMLWEIWQARAALAQGAAK
jgi:hypothetical protein